MEKTIITVGDLTVHLALFGHIEKDRGDMAIGTNLGLSTSIPLPCGGIGMMIGKSLWGGH